MQQKTESPVIGITMGDPSGVGPEIIVKAFLDEGLYDICLPVVIGDRNILSTVIQRLNMEENLDPREIAHVSQAISSPYVINVISLSHLQAYTPGIPQINGGKAMVEYIRYAVEMGLKGNVDAIVTCPISKSLMHRAGFPYDGHTPFLSHLTGAKDYVMMLAGTKLKVSLVTIHCALREVPDLITEESVSRTILITADSIFKDFGVDSPKIAVAGLNPHAGEGGLFGDEEKKIARAISEAKKALSSDVFISGPLPPDTVYYRAANGEFDVVISMYHDQGLIPLKLLHFSDAVNVTLGLPIVRTSVDHGTAYDIAGKGIANPSSLKSAIRMAAEITKNRRKAHTSS